MSPLQRIGATHEVQVSQHEISHIVEMPHINVDMLQYYDQSNYKMSEIDEQPFGGTPEDYQHEALDRKDNLLQPCDQREGKAVEQPRRTYEPSLQCSFLSRENLTPGTLDPQAEPATIDDAFENNCRDLWSSQAYDGGEANTELLPSQLPESLASVPKPNLSKQCKSSVTVFEQGESSSATAKTLGGKGFSLRQLLHFYLKLVGKFGERAHRMSTLHVVQDVIIPESMDKKTSYMESDFMQSCGGGRVAKRFVCHAWESYFLNTVLNIVLDASGWDKQYIGYNFCIYDLRRSYVQGICVEEMLRQLGDDILDTTYWLCIFAVNHHVHSCGRSLEYNSNGRNDWIAEQNADALVQEHLPCACGCNKSKRTDDSFELTNLGQVLQDMEAFVVSLDPDLQCLAHIGMMVELVEAMRCKPVWFRLALGLSKSALSKLTAGLPLTPPIDKCDSVIRDERSHTLQKDLHVMQNLDAFNQLVWSMTELCLGVSNRLPNAVEIVMINLESLRFLQMDGSYRSLSSLEDLGWQNSWILLKGLQHLHLDLSYGVIEKNGFALLEVRLKELVGLQNLHINVSHMNVYNCTCKPIADAIQSLTSLKHLHVHADETLLLDIHMIGSCIGRLQNLLSIDIRFSWPYSPVFESFVDVDNDIASLGHGIERLEHLQQLRMSFAWPIDSDKRFDKYFQGGLGGIYSLEESLRGQVLQIFEANLIGCRGVASSLRQVFRSPLSFSQAIADVQAEEVTRATGVSEYGLFEPSIDIDSHNDPSQSCAMSCRQS